MFPTATIQNFDSIVSFCHIRKQNIEHPWVGQGREVVEMETAKGDNFYGIERSIKIKQGNIFFFSSWLTL